MSWAPVAVVPSTITRWPASSGPPTASPRLADVRSMVVSPIRMSDPLTVRMTPSNWARGPVSVRGTRKRAESAVIRPPRVACKPAASMRSPTATTPDRAVPDSSTCA